MGDRGAEAYTQAYEYIKAGGLYRTEMGRQRSAMRYLLLTASPPLTPDERESAKAEQRRQFRVGVRADAAEVGKSAAREGAP